MASTNPSGEHGKLRKYEQATRSGYRATCTIYDTNLAKVQLPKNKSHCFKHTLAATQASVHLYSSLSTQTSRPNISRARSRARATIRAPIPVLHHRHHHRLYLRLIPRIPPLLLPPQHRRRASKPIDLHLAEALPETTHLSYTEYLQSLKRTR